MHRWVSIPLELFQFFLFLLITALLLFAILTPLFFLLQAQPIILVVVMGITFLSLILLAIIQYQKMAFARFFIAFLAPIIGTLLCAILVSNSMLALSMTVATTTFFLFILLIVLAFNPHPFKRIKTKKMRKKIAP